MTVYSAVIKVSNVINKTIKCEQREGDIQPNLESQSKSKSSMIILGEPARIRAIRTKISKTLQYSCHVLIDNYPNNGLITRCKMTYTVVDVAI